MTELRILQIIKGVDIGGINGGAERFSIDLSEQLEDLGCKVDLCAFFRMNTPGEEDWVDKVREKGLNVFFVTNWDGPNNLRSYINGLQTLRDSVKDSGYDILHSHFQQGTYAALWLKNQLNFPVVVRTSHNVLEWESGFMGKIKEAISDFIYPRRLDVEVGVSQAIVDQLSKRYPKTGKRSKPVLIYNGIKLPTSESNLSFSVTKKNVFTIGSVGRLSEQKGYLYLIDALPQVLRTHPDARVVLLGDGELRSKLEAEVSRLGLNDEVTFAGQVNNVLERLEGFDLFVSSSLWEGLPTVIMEAMAIGVPVIATDIPGSREMISHTKNGWLVSPADPTSLANAIIEMIENPLLRKQISRTGKESVKQYSIQEIAKSYKQLYVTLLAKSGNND